MPCSGWRFSHCRIIEKPPSTAGASTGEPDETPEPTAAAVPFVRLQHMAVSSTKKKLKEAFSQKLAATMYETHLAERDREAQRRHYRTSRPRTHDRGPRNEGVPRNSDEHSRRCVVSGDIADHFKQRAKKRQHETIDCTTTTAADDDTDGDACPKRSRTANSTPFNDFSGLEQAEWLGKAKEALDDEVDKYFKDKRPRHCTRRLQRCCC